MPVRRSPPCRGDACAAGGGFRSCGPEPGRSRASGSACSSRKLDLERPLALVDPVGDRGRELVDAALDSRRPGDAQRACGVRPRRAQPAAARGFRRSGRRGSGRPRSRRSRRARSRGPRARSPWCVRNPAAQRPAARARAARTDGVRPRRRRRWCRRRPPRSSGLSRPGAALGADRPVTRRVEAPAREHAILARNPGGTISASQTTARRKLAPAPSVAPAPSTSSGSKRAPSRLATASASR